MAGEDDEIRISGSLDGDLADALREVKGRVEDVEDSLESAGRAGDTAGSKIAEGADEAATGLRAADRAAESAAESLDDVRDRAERGAKALREAHDRGKEAADELDRVGTYGRHAARSLDDVGTQGRDAGDGLGSAAKGGAAASAALGETAREAKGAARALDDAGDEAMESGVKAAASAPLWERLFARLDRGERLSRKWAAAQGAMKWSTWASGLGKYASGAKALVTGIDWDKSAKGVTKLGKAFGGFKYALMGLKFVAIAQGIYLLLGLLSALGAGAVGAVGGLASLTVGLAAIAPLALAAKLAMIGVKAALKECQPETDALKKKFEGFGTSIAAGGLKQGLKSFTSDASALAGRLNTLGKEFGQASRFVLETAGAYIKSEGFLQRYGVIVGKMPGSLLNMAYSGLNAGKMLVTGMAAASPAANELSGDVLQLTERWTDQADALYESGRMTQVITQGYYNLRRALGVVADWAVGLFRIFKIGAQESAWMGDSIEASAQKFRDWTGTAEGQNSIRKYFQDAMPAVRETGLLIRDLVKGIAGMATNQDLAPLINQIRTQLLPAFFTLAQNLQGNLVPGLVDMATHLMNIFSGLDFSGLQVLVDGINALLKSIIWAQQNIPGFNWMLSALLTTMFLLGPVATVVGKVFGVFSKLGSAFSWISKAKAGTGELTRMQKILGPAFQFIGRIAGWFGSVVGRALLWVFNAFTKLGGVMGILRMIGAAFMAVVGVLGWPVTLIIIAVVAIVAAFVWLWNNCEWFRTGVINILTGIGHFFQTLWLDYVWPALQAIGDFFVWLWTAILWPVIQAIWTGLKVLGAILFVILVAPFLIAFNLISALVIWLWQSVFWPALQGIGNLFVWIFNSIIMPVVNFFVWLWNMACAMVLFAYYAYIVPALTAIGAFFGWVFNSIIMPVVNFFVWLWNLACAAVAFAYYTYILPALSALGAFFGWIFNSVIMPVVNFFIFLWNYMCLQLTLAYYMYVVPILMAFQMALNWLYLNVWTPVVNGILWLWNMLSAGIAFVYYSYIQPAFNALGAGLNVLRGWFDATVAGIGHVWNTLRGLLAAPVNFMINAVWNNGIVKAWNWAASMLGLPQAAPMQPIPEAARGAIMPGRATPGRDTMLAHVGGREAVMRSEWTDAVGDARVYRWNYLARTGGAAAVREDIARWVSPDTRTLASWSNPRMTTGAYGLPAFAGGGIVAPTPASSAPPSSAETDSSFFDMGDWVRGAIAEITDPLINLLPGPPPEWKGVIQSFPRKVRDNIVDWAIKKIEELFASFGGGGGGGAARWAPAIGTALAMKGQPQNLNPVVQRRMNQESGGNPTIVNRWDSNWKKGTPSVGLMQVIGPTYRSHADRRRDVGPYVYGTSIDPLANILASMGYAMSRYGSLAAAYNKAGGYDSGGYLQPGWTPVYNGTGKPEPVFTSDQWDLLSSALPSLSGMHGLLDGSDLVGAMLATPQAPAAVAASVHESSVHREVAELAETVRDLADAVAERPPPVTVFGDEVRKAVREEMAAYQRSQRAKRRYQYAGSGG